MNVPTTTGFINITPKVEEAVQKRGVQEGLQERVNHPSLLRRMTGKAAQDREELAAQEATYRDALQRLAESVGAIETERALAVADQVATHEREKDLARQYLEDRKPEFYKSEELEVQKERSDRGGGRDRDIDGGRERVYHRQIRCPSQHI
jgi:hypothetical protein